VNGRVLAIVFAGFVLAGALVLYNLTRPEPKRPESVPPVGRATAPATKDERKPEPAPPEPAPRPSRRETAKPAAKSAPPPPAPGPKTVEAAPVTGILRVDSDVPGAQVFIDRVFSGATPVTINNVAPGTHRLNVSAPGYDGIVETVDVVAGPRDILIKLKEVRLDVKIAVVHKHRMGACRGQLIATPQGLRYDTADKDDGFNVPLRDLETFQVDYLEKNLKVKLQKGRRYDFTDPDGNADRLFVFHRDVEKARDRLKKGDPPASP
jgi:hypothetical protein